MRFAVVIVAIIGAAAAIVASAEQSVRAELLNPASLHETAPATFTATFTTTAGMFVVQVHRDWAPRGADRFYTLVKHGFYVNCRFFRVVPKFMAQFGIHGNPAVSAAWEKATIPPDRALQSNTRGRLSFAQGTMPNTRSTQVFINYGDNSRLDIDGFAPFGEVTSSMVLVEQIYSKYGEDPDQALIQTEGNAYLARFFPKLDYIKSVTIDASSASR